MSSSIQYTYAMCHLWPVHFLQYFFTLSHKRHDFRNKLFSIKCVFSFSGALAKLRKTIITFLHLRSSVRTEHLNSHWIEFHEILHMNIFQKRVEHIQVSLKSDENKGYFTRRPIYIFLSSRLVLLRMKNFQQQKIVILCPVTFLFSKIVPFMR